MKNLFIIALLMSGSAFAFPPQPEILQPQSDCTFTDSNNFGACYKNDTGEVLSNANITIKTMIDSATKTYSAPVAPLSDGQYAVLSTTAQHLIDEKVDFLIYSLSIEGKTVCWPTRLQAAEMAKPSEFVIKKFGDTYVCWAAN